MTHIMFILGFRHLNTHKYYQNNDFEFVKYTLMSMEAAIIILSFVIR